MRTYALTHGGVITRIVEATSNPFHKALAAVDVTGIPAQVGNTVDAVGNVGPSPVLSPADVPTHKRTMLVGEGIARAHAGVWLPKGDPEGHLFDTSPASLGMLSALAAGGSSVAPTMDGTAAEMSAKDVLEAVGAYLAECFMAENKLAATLADNPEADVSQGWPDNGMPDGTAYAEPAQMTPVAGRGTGIIPEVQPDSVTPSGPAVAGVVEAPAVVAP